MNNRLYVGNLSYDVASEALQACFAEFGTVQDSHVVTDRETGRPRGFAFVTMGNADEAARAVAKLNNSMFEGRVLRVDVAEERAPRSGGGGARSGGGGRSSGHRSW